MTATLKVDTIKEVNSSVDNLALDSSGNVTVGNNLTVTGTTTQTGAQTFNGTTTFNGTLTLNTPSTTTARNINWSNGTGTVATVAGYSDSTTTGHLEFYTLQSGTTPTEQMRIDQYGSLLVGTTTSPTTTTGLGTISAAGTVVMGSSFLRNRIINGDMRIAQRGTTAVTISSSYPVDRFVVGNTSDGAFSAQQDTSSPAGFINSVKITTTTADASLTTTQNLNFRQVIEGVNVSDLAWGTANAKTITLSFWVRSSLTGTFSGGLRNSSSDRSYIYTYTISSADTWEYKSVTIAGDTSGTWLTDTGVGITVFFSLGAGPDRTGTAGSWTSNNAFSVTGSVSVIGTLNATWYVTGVQLEVGSVATPFERRLYGQELTLCQRYYQTWGGNSSNERIGNCFAYSGSQARADLVLTVTMRTAPTLTYSAVGDWAIEGAFGAPACTGIALDQASTKVASTNFTAAVTSGQGAHVMSNGTSNARFNLSAEL